MLKQNFCEKYIDKTNDGCIFSKLFGFIEEIEMADNKIDGTFVPKGIKREDGFCWLSEVMENLPEDSVYRRVIRVGKHSYFTGYSDGYDAVPFFDHIRYPELADKLGEKLIIGKYVCIAPDVVFILGGNQNHPTEGSPISQHPLWDVDKRKREWAHLKGKGDTVIGDNVWICSGATIQPGVKIGEGARILPGAYVTKDVEPYAVCGGVPGKTVGKRFDNYEIKLLTEKIRWTQWPDDVIGEYAEELTSPRPDFSKLVKVADDLEEDGRLKPLLKIGDQMTLRAFMNKQNSL